MAGVSGRTYEHATEMLDKAPEPVVEAARNKELSIDASYEVTKMPQEQQAEISERIEHGEKPKAVVADVKKRQKQAKRDNKAKRSESTQEDSKVQLTLEGEPEDMTAETSENETSSEKYKVISLSLGTDFKKGLTPMASKRYAIPDRERCVSCGACAVECPRNAISIWRGCPANCIELVQREGAE